MRRRTMQHAAAAMHRTPRPWSDAPCDMHLSMCDARPIRPCTDATVQRRSCAFIMLGGTDATAQLRSCAFIMLGGTDATAQRRICAFIMLGGTDATAQRRICAFIMHGGTDV